MARGKVKENNFTKVKIKDTKETGKMARGKDRVKLYIKMGRHMKEIGITT